MSPRFAPSTGGFQFRSSSGTQASPGRLWLVDLAGGSLLGPWLETGQTQTGKDALISWRQELRQR